MTSFATDIRPLFRETDVDAMRQWFDLSTYDDVRTNATGIYERVMDGSMPCDAAWAPERGQLFQRWMDEGFPR